MQADGRPLRVNPATAEVTATVSSGNSSSHLAVYGGAVWAMAQVEEFRLARVDPGTVRVAAAEDIGSIVSERASRWNTQAIRRDER